MDQTPGARYDISIQAEDYEAETPRKSARRSVHESAGSRSRQGNIYLCAVAENRCKEIGLAVFSIRSAEIILIQFADSQSYSLLLTKLLTYEPKEVLIPNNALELESVIKVNFPQMERVCVARKYFSETKGLHYVKELSWKDHNLDLDISSKYLCLSAVAALLKYIEYIQNISFAPESLRVTFRGSEGCLMLDRNAIKSLEVLSSARTGDAKNSLFGVMNHTKTAAGARLLRITLLNVFLQQAYQQLTLV